MTDESYEAAMHDEDKPRVVVVVGASSGIGAACADRLAGGGWRVIALQRSPLPLGADKRIRFIRTDVQKDDAVVGAIEMAAGDTGRIDALVNCAGYAIMGSLEETAIAEARAVMETNFFGTLRVCRAVAPIMRAQRAGHIINISSLAGIVGLPFSGIYSASKFAVEGMTESLRLELLPFGIQVVLVEPGYFKTALPTRRLVVAASTNGSPYAAAMAATTLRQGIDEASAPSPSRVAALVERLLQQKRPNLRHPIGRREQTVVVPMKRYLPQRVFEFALRTATGISSQFAGAPELPLDRRRRPF